MLETIENWERWTKTSVILGVEFNKKKPLSTSTERLF